MAHDTIEKTHTVTSNEYTVFLKNIKERILASQVKAAVAVNRELIALYWEIVSALGEKLLKASWGAKIVGSP